MLKFSQDNQDRFCCNCNPKKQKKQNSTEWKTQDFSLINTRIQSIFPLTHTKLQ